MSLSRLLLRRWLCAVSALAFTFTISVGRAAPDPAALDETHASVRAVMALQAAVTRDLLKEAGVLGTAVGLDHGGSPALVVYLDRDAASVGSLVRALPPQMRGIAVKAELTDKFRAFKRPPNAGGGGNGGGPIVS